MRESLRARLLIWYGAIVAIVVAIFAAVACYLEWRAEIGDLDRTLRSRAAALVAALAPTGDGTFDLALPGAPGDAGVLPDHILWTNQGEVIDRSDGDLEPLRPGAEGPRTRGDRREYALRAPSGAWVLTSLPLDDARAEVWALGVAVGGAGLAAISLAIAGGWWWVGRALAPVARISRTARAMSEGDFAARIPVDRVETELGQLARALNDAFDRLHASLERQRQFAADASHELRTPLTTISTESQWALGRTRSAEEYRKSLEICRRGADRMKAVVERLLALARLEAAAPNDRVEPVRLDAVVAAVVDDLRPLADARDVSIDVQAEPVNVTGNPVQLTEALTNVVVNGLQYNRPGGRVSVSLQRAGGTAQLLVEDTGVGIESEHLPRVFEPFFRADPARSRDAGGAGLGLAVSRAIIARHGGTIGCTSIAGRGTTVRITLPG